MEQHKFVKFVSLKGDVSLGFMCGTNAKQVMPNAGEQRVITALCCCCGRNVRFDTGRFRWRLWFLPRRAFAVTQRRKLLTLSGGWSGHTDFTRYEDVSSR